MNRDGCRGVRAGGGGGDGDGDNFIKIPSAGLRLGWPRLAPTTPRQHLVLGEGPKSHGGLHAQLRLNRRKR